MANITEIIAVTYKKRRQEFFLSPFLATVSQFFQYFQELAHRHTALAGRLVVLEHHEIAVAASSGLRPSRSKVNFGNPVSYLFLTHHIDKAIPCTLDFLACMLEFSRPFMLHLCIWYTRIHRFFACKQKYSPHRSTREVPSTIFRESGFQRPPSFLAYQSSGRARRFWL